MKIKRRHKREQRLMCKKICMGRKARAAPFPHLSHTCSSLWEPPATGPQRTWPLLVYTPCKPAHCQPFLWFMLLPHLKLSVPNSPKEILHTQQSPKQKPPHNTAKLHLLPSHRFLQLLFHPDQEAAMNNLNNNILFSE